MTRKPNRVKKVVRFAPNLPQHNLPAPYNRLLMIGEDAPEAACEAVARELKQGDASEAIEQLLTMANDHTYYEYARLSGELNRNDGLDDPRLWTRAFALHTFSLLGPAAERAVDRLIPFLDDEDEDVIEVLLEVFANLGAAGIDPLIGALESGSQEAQGNAVECLVAIAETHENLAGRVLPVLEARLATETENTYLNAVIVIGLLDLGAVTMMPLIRQAYAENRVDQVMIDLPEVEEAFGLEVTSPWSQLPYSPEDLEEAEDYTDTEITETGYLPARDEKVDVVPQSESAEPNTPYVAPVKAGRNDPCPCGSGLKYKKCCGK